MKKILITLALVFAFGLTMAQKGQPGSAEAKLEAARIALITERLELTPAQAQQFWPVYNEFARERRMIQEQYRNTRRQYDLKNLSEEEGQRLMNAGLETKQKVLDLEKEYSKRLHQVVTAKQMMALRKAEEDFRDMVLRRLEQRRMQQQRMRDREKKVQQGNN